MSEFCDLYLCIHFVAACSVCVWMTFFCSFSPLVYPCSILAVMFHPFLFLQRRRFNSENQLLLALDVTCFCTHSSIHLHNSHCYSTPAAGEDDLCWHNVHRHVWDKCFYLSKDTHEHCDIFPLGSVWRHLSSTSHCNEWLPALLRTHTRTHTNQFSLQQQKEATDIDYKTAEK